MVWAGMTSVAETCEPKLMKEEERGGGGLEIAWSNSGDNVPAHVNTK